MGLFHLGPHPQNRQLSTYVRSSSCKETCRDFCSFSRYRIQFLPSKSHGCGCRLFGSRPGIEPAWFGSYAFCYSPKLWSPNGANQTMYGFDWGFHQVFHVWNELSTSRNEQQCSRKDAETATILFIDLYNTYGYHGCNKSLCILISTFCTNQPSQTLHLIVSLFLKKCCTRILPAKSIKQTSLSTTKVIVKTKKHTKPTRFLFDFIHSEFLM